MSRAIRCKCAGGGSVSRSSLLNRRIRRAEINAQAIAPPSQTRNSRECARFQIIGRDSVSPPAVARLIDSRVATGITERSLVGCKGWLGIRSMDSAAGEPSAESDGQRGRWATFDRLLAFRV